MRPRPFSRKIFFALSGIFFRRGFTDLMELFLLRDERVMRGEPEGI